MLSYLLIWLCVCKKYIFLNLMKNGLSNPVTFFVILKGCAWSYVPKVKILLKFARYHFYIQLIIFSHLTNVFVVFKIFNYDFIKCLFY